MESACILVERAHQSPQRQSVGGGGVGTAAVVITSPEQASSSIHEISNFGIEPGPLTRVASSRNSGPNRAEMEQGLLTGVESSQNSGPNRPETTPESHTGGTTGPIDDGMKKLGEVFLAMTGQAVVSLMTYTQNGNSSYLAKTKWASYFVKAAIAVGFIATLIAVFLLHKKKGAADIFQKIGIIATVCAFIVALGTSFIPG
ncbi:uncharacterized protein LOC132294681 [Cornus florida]|uniref:uncharacterized protein LOC132294681 n=1 Tax=Cornus florida TaxID=4283 RepID=UPI002897CD3B|nr:uncharacterized protein LOC132294681 [Cornus florida]